MRTALDTNILSAIWDREATAARLIDVLNDCRHRGSIVLCAATFAETLAHPGMAESAIKRFLDETEITVDFEMAEPIWVEAGRRFSLYAERRRHSSGSQPGRILADFVIGAHAMLTADRLVTLDQGRYARDFPELVLL